MITRILLVITYIWHCLLKRTLPSRFFQLNAEHFNDEKGLFSKLDLNERIHPRWRLSQYSVDAMTKPIKYPVFLKPEWGQNSAGVFLVNNDFEFDKVLKNSCNNSRSYLIQECSYYNKEFEVYLILSAETPDHYAQLSVSEVINSEDDILPINGIYNKSTNYLDITDTLSSQQLSMLWSYLKMVGSYRMARFGIKAQSIESMISGDFKIFELNLFLPMPIALLCNNIGFFSRLQLINKFTRDLAKITITLPKVKKKKYIFFRTLLSGKKNTFKNDKSCKKDASI